MGQAKQAWIESEARGYSLPVQEDKFVCARHFNDIYLKQFILDHSVRGRCSYCSCVKKVIDLHNFMKYVTEKITQHFGNPCDEDLYLANSFYDNEYEVIPGFKRVGCFIAPTFAEQFDNTSELLFELDLITNNEILNNDIESCFITEEWIQQYAYMMTRKQELSFMWKLFSGMVMHEQRFTFFKRPEFVVKVDSEDNDLKDILNELGNIISGHDLSRVIKKGTEIYRCRFFADGETFKSFEDITSPPNNKAKQSRMSPAGVSMFYGAFNEETAILEGSPNGDLTNDNHASGRFKTKVELRVLDLTRLPSPSFWIPLDWQGIEFLHSFNREIIKPIERDDRIHFQYVPSQVFTEYLRYIYRSIDNSKINGIIYQSSLKSATEKNIVLFYNQYESREILDLIEITYFPKLM